MKLRVLYFAGIREKVGCEAETLELPESVVTVADLRVQLVARGGAWRDALEGTRNLRVAVNQAMALAPLLPSSAWCVTPTTGRRWGR